MFYNTTNEVNPQLELFKKKTDKQDVLIFAEFTKNPDKNHSASSLYQLFELKGLKWPITSIRRSLTGLHQRNQIKVVSKQVGMFGRNENVYMLNI